MTGQTPSTLRIAVGIATIGRAPILPFTLAALHAQTRTPDDIVLCAASDADVCGVDAGQYNARIVYSRPGLCAQRNHILRAARTSDVVVFFDDDFLMHRDYLKAVDRLFSADPAVIMSTGNLIADGIGGPGFETEEGWSLLEKADTAGTEGTILDVYNAYGCNMAIRMAPMLAHDLRFDESLPLYAWLEDVDFSRRLSPYGRIVRMPDARGVHLGTKKGRQSGVRLGYSQIANPLHLVRKGTMAWHRAAAQMGRNMTANTLRLMNSEPYVDRPGRMAGNLRAIADLLAGRLHPMRILEL